MIIDSEFQALIPALSETERSQLEANLLADGCRDPLVVWQNKLLDGHNRFDICTRHGIDYQVVEQVLSDREAAKDWIDANQLGRRNLTADAFKLALGRRYNRTKKAVGSVNQHTVARDQIEPQQKTADKFADEYGVSAATVKRAGKFAEEIERTPELQSAIAEKKPVLQARRELKEKARESRRDDNREKISKAHDLSEAKAKFATILIDPPWDWGDEADGDQLGRARPTYGTMALPELLDLPVTGLADDDCHIYLWITNRSLPKGFQLLDKWGFRYITALTWCKPHFGMGNYFRGSTEHVLFGVRGSQPLKRRDVGTWFEMPRGPQGHSSKPVDFYDLVESCSPGPYLEMFARSGRELWTTWGAEANAA